MARKKRYTPYRQGGKVVPGMFKAQDGVELKEAINVNIQQGNDDVNVSEFSRADTQEQQQSNQQALQQQDQNAINMKEILQQKLMISQAQQAQKDAALKELLNQMKLQNDSLIEERNELRAEVAKWMELAKGKGKEGGG